MTLAVEDDLFEVEVGTTELNNVDIEVWTTLGQLWDNVVNLRPVGSKGISIFIVCNSQTESKLREAFKNVLADFVR